MNVALAWLPFGRGGPFDTQLTERLGKFYAGQMASYPGMDSVELIMRVMEAGLTCYLFFVPNITKRFFIDLGLRKIYEICSN